MRCVRAVPGSSWRHEDSCTTADIYEQDIDDSDHAVALLENVMGCDLAEAHDVFAKRRASGAKPSRDAKSPPRRAMEHSWTSENLSLCRDFRGAAEGTRTLDLLHGKRCEVSPWRRTARRRRPCMTGALPATPGFDTVVSVWFLSRSRRLDLASWFAPREMRTCGCDAIAFTRKECCGGDAVALSQREAAPMQPRRLEKKRNTGETGDRGTTGVPSGRPGNRGPPVAHRSARPLMTADQREGRASDPHDAPR